MRRPPVLVLLVAAGSLAVAGCHGVTRTTRNGVEPMVTAGLPATRMAACKAVTRGDVEMVLDEQVTKATAASGPNGSTSCVYQGSLGTVTVRVDPTTGRSAYDAARRAAPDAEPTDGVGDDGFYSARAHTLSAVKGGAQVTITFALTEPQDELETGSELARRAISRF